MHSKRLVLNKKILKPSSIVDKILKDQGFNEKITINKSYYFLRLKDSVTRTNYELQISFKSIFLTNNEPLYKLQELVVIPISPLMKDKSIPDSILTAAFEKAYEVFSYIESIKTFKISR